MKKRGVQQPVEERQGFHEARGKTAHVLPLWTAYPCVVAQLTHQLVVRGVRNPTLPLTARTITE